MKPGPGVFAASLVVATLTGCSTHSSNFAVKPSCCAAPEAPATFTDQSIYQAESMWVTDQGTPLKLGELGGHPQIVAMFFAHCQFACPIIVNDMKRIEAALPAELRAQVGFTLVSFDTKRDTPAALAAYRLAHALPSKNWTLLHGEPDDVLELAALLGLQFKEDANGQFAHSNMITILNAQGEIVHQQIGLNQDIQETVRLLRKLAPKGSQRTRDSR
jgi:protein SCO1/2